jgi:uncharacterized damage-inducible protein DinB
MRPREKQGSNSVRENSVVPSGLDSFSHSPKASLCQENERKLPCATGHLRDQERPITNLPTIGRPQPSEAASDYFKYIDQVAGNNPVRAIENQLDESLPLLATISEEKSLHRYAQGKWSIRQVLNHVTDTERSFAYRALWFARGFDTPLLSYEQDIAAAGAAADAVSWAAHIEEFMRVRLATISLFQNLPPDAWMRTGTVSEKRLSVRALAFIIPGHVTHHLRILRERYL